MNDNKDTVCEKLTERCAERFNQMFKKIDRLDAAIRGNGHPGILLRLDRLEQSARVQSRIIWIMAGALITGITAAIMKFAMGI